MSRKQFTAEKIIGMLREAEVFFVVVKRKRTQV